LAITSPTAGQPARHGESRGFASEEKKGRWTDLLIAALSLGAYVFWIYRFRYQGLLGEDDLYRVLVGLLDGARHGTGLASPNHYGKAFSFGYIAAIYQFAGAQNLANPQPLMALMNAIGFWAAAAGCFLFWLLSWMLYGLRAATIAVILFALSPMMLELGASGHPILPAFALCAASALCLLAPMRGGRATALVVIGAALLVAALATRAEVGLAVPFLVLARADFRTLPRLVKSATLRAIGPALAVGVFLALKRICADSTAGSAHLVPFLRQFIRIKEIPVGVFVFTLSCGIVTTVVGMVAVFAAVRACRAASSLSAQSAALLRSAIGPLLLIAVPLLFWIANPRPGRHFIFCLAGGAMLAAQFIARYASPRPSLPYALTLGIVLANQGMATLTGPLILKYAPSKILLAADGTHHLPRGVPTGSSWSYHRAFVAEEARTDAFAALAAHPCDDKTLVMSLNATQIFSDLYAQSSQWDPTEHRLANFPVQQAHIGSRTVLVLAENEGWPADAAAVALAQPGLRDYKLIRDPESLSVYDHVVIPSNRMARLGCSP